VSEPTACGVARCHLDSSYCARCDLLVGLDGLHVLTVNHDEPVYLLQADALRHGKLFPPAPTPADAFLPWLSVTSGDHYVSKYAPVHPAVIALARTVSGTDRAGLALIAAGLVVTFRRWKRESLDDVSDEDRARVEAALRA